jgi:hypothetical protein
MPDLYLPGAELHILDNAPTVGDGGARAGWHVTWDKNATAAAPADLVPFGNLVGYFTGGGKGVAPHLLWNPFTGQMAQFFSATSRSKSFVNGAGGVETNRKGNVMIQVEILFFPHCRVDGKTYATVADTPCIGLDKLMAWLRSWGVPDVWPMGEPTWSSNRNAAVWNTQPGHYGHSQVPENTHTDPGPMPRLFAVSAPKPTPAPPAKASAPAFVRTLRRGDSGTPVRTWQRRMRDRGWPIAVDGRFGPATEAVVRAFQTEKHLIDDGVVGPITWAAAWTAPITH